MLYICIVCFLSIQSHAETLDTLLKNTHSMQAKFVEKVITNQQVKRVIKGKVWLEVPNKFRWEVISPNKELFISDGKKLLHYTPELQQATLRHLSEKTSNTVFLVVLSQPKLLHKMFKVTTISKQEFKLLSKHPDSLLQDIYLKFKHDVLYEISFMNSAGQRTVIRLYNCVINQKISQAMFKFVLPKNVDIYQMS